MLTLRFVVATAILVFCAFGLALSAPGSSSGGSGSSASEGASGSSTGAPAQSGTGAQLSSAHLATLVPGEIPMTRREDVSDELHGVKVADPYRWLEKVDSPDVQEWMKSQDTVTRARLATLPTRDALRSRFTELFYVDWISAPIHRGDRWFYTRRKAKQEKAVLYWKNKNGKEHVLIDPNGLTADGSISLGEWVPSYDGKYLAYSLHKNNSDSARMYVRDVESGKDLENEVIEDSKYASPSWTPDSKGFYYTWLPIDPSIPKSELPGFAEVRFHSRGTDPKTDRLVHPALHDPTAFLGSGMSRDGRFLLLQIQHGWTSNDIYYKDLESASPAPAEQQPAPPGGKGASGSEATLAAGFRPLVVGQDALYSVVPWKGTFYVTTNEGAPRYRVFKVDPRTPGRSNWKEIVPEKDSTLEAADVVGNTLVLNYLDHAANRMEICDLEGKPIRKVTMPGIGSTNGMIGNPDEDEAYYGFTSFTELPQIYKTSIKTGKTSLWEIIKYPVDTSTVVAEQVFYTSKDGTRVSMFLVHRKDMKRNGNNPTLLTGYGGFNQNETPIFSASAVVWLDHGGVFAVPNLRGGGEYGEEWHRAGMLTRKQNVFDDFIAAAEWLISEKITSPQRLSILGGSNGGLLVGAAMVQRPDLYRAVICAVPLLDMVRYHLFGAGKTWIEEYGSADDAEQFKAIYAYSPYHHVKEGTSYPAMLVLSADSDDRVDPMHARKFTAAVQTATSSKLPVLLRIERHAGHGGADLIRQKVEQSTDTFAFLMDQLGMK